MISSILLVINLMFPSLANASEFRKFECVDSGLLEIEKQFTRYNDYSKMEGAEFSLSGVNIIRMIKSQSKNPSVWIVLQPVYLDKSELYPRFLLNCTTKKTQNSFIQNCLMQTDKQKFGLNNLIIELVAKKNAESCDSGKVGLAIKVIAEINNSEVKQIQKEVLKSAGALEPFLTPLFEGTEDMFFNSYFNNLYSQWIKNL